MKLGIIGGSGLYDIEALQEAEWITVDTPFGPPSDQYLRGRLGRIETVFLPRHGRGHRLLPAEINHRANILGFRQLGVERVIAFNAVGSLRDDLHPRDIVIPDQYFDRTKRGGDHTFFGDGIAVHVGFGDPLCPQLRADLLQAARRVLARENEAKKAVDGGTYVNMEGPAFSTRAESLYYRRCGFDLIGMTGLAEAKLCREAGLCYAAAALVTDYDCWHETEEDVSARTVIEHLLANVRTAQEILLDLGDGLPEESDCACRQALDQAVLTPRELWPQATYERLKLLLDRMPA